MIVHDLRCKHCNEVEENVLCAADQVSKGKFPPCSKCRGNRTWVPARINTDLWGQSTYVASLDREFGSKSELRAHLKANGLSEAGDRVGGARNESHLGLGKTFSYRGQGSRTTASEGK